MSFEPIQALQAAAREPLPVPSRPRLLIAGATGVLGAEVLRRLVGLQLYSVAQVLAREPLMMGLRGVGTTVVPGDEPAAWPPAAADVGLVMFEPARLFHERERPLWTPVPAQLPALAAWMRRSGVQTLAVVLPHAQGRLPDALKQGLASLDEHAVASLGFERLLIVRSAQQPSPPAPGNPLVQLADRMLSIFRYMVPSTEQPVRAVKVAEFVSASLAVAPPGIHVASPERVWRAAQGDVGDAVRQWLGR